jgi:Coenzyme PQQ synthesis protein D (PqqD)
MTGDGSFRVRPDGVAWRDVGGDVIVLDVDRSLYHGINSSGAPLWHALVGGASASELVDELARRHPEAAHRAEEDVRAFLQDLVAAGLVEEPTSG